MGVVIHHVYPGVRVCVRWLPCGRPGFTCIARPRWLGFIKLPLQKVRGAPTVVIASADSSSSLHVDDEGSECSTTGDVATKVASLAPP